MATLAAPAVAIAQHDIDANIVSSCTATINDPAGAWRGLGANPPAMSVDVLCNVAYSMTQDDHNSGAHTGHMVAHGAGALTGTALTDRLYVTSTDVVSSPLDGMPVAIIAPKPRDLDEVAETYALSYVQATSTSDPVLSSGTWRMVFLFSLTQIPN